MGLSYLMNSGLRQSVVYIFVYKVRQYACLEPLLRLATLPVGVYAPGAQCTYLKSSCVPSLKRL